MPPSWPVVIGTESDGTIAHALAVDGEGNLLVAGTCSSAVSFGSIRCEKSGFVGKLDPQRGWLWLTSLPGASGLAVDPAGSSYIVGEFYGTARFGTTTLTSPGSTTGAGFVSRLDAQGKVLWAIAPKADSSRISRVAVSPKGGVVVAGSFVGAAYFGTIPVPSPVAGADALVVGQVTMDGQFEWATAAPSQQVPQYQTYPRIEPTGLAVGAEGDVHVVGSLWAATKLGSTVLDAGGFVAGLDAGGTFVWATAADSPSGVAVGAGGAIYVAGTVGGGTPGPGSPTPATTLSRLSPTGTTVWSRAAYPPSSPAGTLAIDGQGNVLLAGFYGKTAAFGAQVLPAALCFPDDPNMGMGAVFVARADPAGLFTWADGATPQTQGGCKTDTVAGVAVDPSGTVYVAGGFLYAMTFSGTSFTTTKDHALFIWRLTPP